MTSFMASDGRGRAGRQARRTVVSKPTTFVVAAGNQKLHLGFSWDVHARPTSRGYLLVVRAMYYPIAFSIARAQTDAEEEDGISHGIAWHR